MHSSNFPYSEPDYDHRLDKTINQPEKNKNMNFDNISASLMMIYDELKNDKQSKALLRKIDKAQSDEEVKAGIVAGVKRLRELEKFALAEDIEKKTKGFAF